MLMSVRFKNIINQTFPNKCEYKQCYRLHSSDTLTVCLFWYGKDISGGVRKYIVSDTQATSGETNKYMSRSTSSPGDGAVGQHVIHRQIV